VTELTNEQGELCVRTLAAIAWTDDHLDDEEMDRIIRLVNQLEYLDASQVQEILHMPVRLTFLDRIKTLDRAVRIRLLHDAYLVASYTGTVGDGEKKMIQDLAATVVAPERWEEVEACLESYAAYERRCQPLWGVTHLG
jgi:tellurite resistance protein